MGRRWCMFESLVLLFSFNKSIACVIYSLRSRHPFPIPATGRQLATQLRKSEINRSYLYLLINNE